MPQTKALRSARLFVLSAALACLLASATVTASLANKSPIPAKLATSSQQFEGLMGGQIDLSAYKGKVVLVVNTASECGYTGQYAGLERLWKARRRDGLVIVGVPSNDFGGQEPGSAAEIKKFCELNYGVSFPMAAKYSVRGPNAHPFYRNSFKLLGAKAEPKWNFHKILIGKDGRPIDAFPSAVTPDAKELKQAINAALAAPKA
jgi:glutathione peroxidase